MDYWHVITKKSCRFIIILLRLSYLLGYFSQILRKGDSVCFVTVKPNVTWLYSADPNHLLKVAQEVQPGIIQILIQ